MRKVLLLIYVIVFATSAIGVIITSTMLYHKIDKFNYWMIISIAVFALVMIVFFIKEVLIPMYKPTDNEQLNTRAN
jgi:tellurite resistance protein TehA-like permease